MSKAYPSQMGRSGLGMPEKLQIYDMVWGIANTNRFNGTSDRMVTVAAHCLTCATLAEIWQPENTELQFFALVHDLPEAYYGDIPGYLKDRLGPDVRLVLEDIDTIIYDQMGLPLSARIRMKDDLKRIDNNVLALEAAYAFDKFEPYHWPPMDLYDKLDIVEDYTKADPAFITKIYSDLLEHYGKTNETLAKLLHQHRAYSFPNRWKRAS